MTPLRLSPLLPPVLAFLAAAVGLNMIVNFATAWWRDRMWRKGEV